MSTLEEVKTRLLIVTNRWFMLETQTVRGSCSRFKGKVAHQNKCIVSCGRKVRNPSTHLLISSEE